MSNLAQLSASLVRSLGDVDDEEGPEANAEVNGDATQRPKSVNPWDDCLAPSGEAKCSSYLRLSRCKVSSSMSVRRFAGCLSLMLLASLMLNVSNVCEGEWKWHKMEDQKRWSEGGTCSV